MAHPDDSHRLEVMSMSFEVSFPMALRAAIQLKVFEIIAEGGPGAELSPPEMVDKMPTTNPNAAVELDRILRVLVPRSILTARKEPNADDGGKGWTLYGLTPQSLCLLGGRHGPSLAPFVEFGLLKPLIDCLYNLAASVLEGGTEATPFRRTHGAEFFEYLGTHKEIGGVFHDSMSNVTATMMANIFEVYDGFKDVKEIVDVGGGNGTCLSLIVQKFPHIRGINFDLPYVIALAPQYPGVEHVAGDMYETVPTAADTIFTRGVLHTCSDEQCLTVLKNCWKALPDHGKVIAIEFAVPPEPGTGLVSRYLTGVDLVMMVSLPGGRQRTASEFTDLAKAAGFAKVKVFPASYANAIMEFHKT